MALAVPAQAPDEPAHKAALRIAKLGPRPAAITAERRAHAIPARAFRRAGLEVRRQSFAVPGRGRSRNVIGVHDGPARCLHVVMAHTDSTPAGPGANDNASGVGVLMALAPGLRKRPPRCDVWLVATGAEERVYTGSPDHLGALALARRLRARKLARRLRFALSLDEVGRGRSFWLRSPVQRTRAGVEGKVLAQARGLVPLAWVPDVGTGNSDHREIQMLGMRAAKLGVDDRGEPCRHMACDRPRRLDPRSLTLARRLVGRVLRTG